MKAEFMATLATTAQNSRLCASMHCFGYNEWS